MRTIFIIMDSLNRHYISPYNKDAWVQTPNLDRLAKRSMIFNNHYCGSMPCMPARREMMTGRLNFLEAPWGPIEPWDDCLPVELRKQKNTYSHMITDHYHYFHSGGEAYHTLFDSWEFERGQESDQWHPLVIPPELPETFRNNSQKEISSRRAYWTNRFFRDPENDLDYPTPRCFQRAVEFLENNNAADNWHLHLEVFDPHEPFDCPEKYSAIYDDEWCRGIYNWPPYEKLNQKYDDPQAVSHIRKQYAGSITMADHWLGKLLDKMDEFDMWKDTTLILTTDHGHLLGEHGYWAKNYMFDYNELSHIPLFVHHPGTVPREIEAITATMDIMPTLMDLHGASLPGHVHGKSFSHLFVQDGTHHDAILFGYFGKNVNLRAGEYTYCRQPAPDTNVYLHTAMPRGFHDFIPRDTLAAAEYGVFLDTAYNIPHLRIPTKSYIAESQVKNPLYNIVEDPGQKTPVKEPVLEKKLSAVLKDKLKEFDAPFSQFERLELI